MLLLHVHDFSVINDIQIVQRMKVWTGCKCSRLENPLAGYTWRKRNNQSVTIWCLTVLHGTFFVMSDGSYQSSHILVKSKTWMRSGWIRLEISSSFSDLYDPSANLSLMQYHENLHSLKRLSTSQEFETNKQGRMRKDHCFLTSHQVKAAWSIGLRVSLCRPLHRQPAEISEMFARVWRVQETFCVWRSLESKSLVEF